MLKRNGKLALSIYRNGKKAKGYYRNGALSSFASRLISQMAEDIKPIPDERNTGVQDGVTLTQSSGAGTYGEVPMVLSSGDTKLSLNMYNGTFQGPDVQLLCENYDFSADLPMTIINSNIMTDANNRNLTVTFRNCKFNGFSAEVLNYNVNVVFEHCEFEGSINYSGIICRYCKFGGTVYDAVRPMKNFHMYDCYIRDLAHLTAVTSYHSDGVQTYGHSSLPVCEDLRFENVRIDVPPLKFSGNNGTYVNAALMFQQESSPADDVTVKDVKMTGGGYALYCWDKSGGSYPLTNFLFENVRVGCTQQYGLGYGNNEPSVDYSDVLYETKLFVSTVERDGGNTKLYVTNYTNAARDLVVVTNQGSQTINIPACLEYGDIVEDVTTFADFPFNVEITLNDEFDWLVCYDTADADENQIRFEKWIAEEVYR